MKVIQITDADADELVASLELGKWRGSRHWMPEDLRETFSEDQMKALEAWVHRSFHHLVVRWLQKHGATLTDC